MHACRMNSRCRFGNGSHSRFTVPLPKLQLILQDFCDADGSVVAEEGSPELMQQAEDFPGHQNPQAPVYAG